MPLDPQNHIYAGQQSRIIFTDFKFLNGHICESGRQVLIKQAISALILIVMIFMIFSDNESIIVVSDRLRSQWRFRLVPFVWSTKRFEKRFYCDLNSLCAFYFCKIEPFRFFDGSQCEISLFSIFDRQNLFAHF